MRIDSACLPAQLKHTGSLALRFEHRVDLIAFEARDRALMHESLKRQRQRQ